MKKLFSLVALALIYSATYAQNMAFVPVVSPPNMLEDHDDFFDEFMLIKTLSFKDEEVQFTFGNFEEVPGYPGTSDIYYTTTKQIVPIESKKSFSRVYDVVNDVYGAVVLATDQGVFVFGHSGTFSKIVSANTKCIYPRADGTLIYSDEILNPNPTLTNTTNLYLLSNVGSTLIVSKKCIATGYEESDTIGFFSSSLQLFHGAFGDYLFPINLNTWEVMDAPYLFPEDDGNYCAAGGYGPVVKAGGKLFIRGNGLDDIYQVWDGDSWTSPLTEYEGTFNVINDELYMGPFKVNEDYSVTPVPVIGDEMAWGAINYFNNEWYIYSSAVEDMISIGDITTNGSEFYNSAFYHTPVYSGIAKISSSTGVMDDHPQSINIFPNPADDNVSVDGLIDVSIFNLMGKRLDLDWIDNSTLNTKSFAPGTYFVFGKNDSGTVSAQFIVQH